MNLLADEGVDRQIVEALRLAGHHVLYVAEMEPGIADDIVLQKANTQSALLITQDKDFGELVYRQGLVHQGVVLVRLGGLTPQVKAGYVCAALAQYEQEMQTAFTVVSPGQVRIRQH